MIPNQVQYTVVGSMISLVITGPLGAIFGGLVGHGIDKLIDSSTAFSRDNTLDPMVHTCLIALSAKFTDDPEVVNEIFDIPNRLSAKRIKIFKQIQDDELSVDPYIVQLADKFKIHPKKLENILNGLFKLVIMAGFMSQQKLDYLSSLAQTFNLTNQFENIKRAYTSLYPIIDLEPYQVLGLPYTETDENIKNRYIELINEYHPDRSIARGLPQDIIDARSTTLSTITVAYNSIRKERSLQKI